MGRRSLAFALLLLFLSQEDSIAAIDRVWTCGGFDCSRLISGAGDTFNASGADSTIACKTGTTAQRPPTCAIGECYFDTSVTAGTNLYGCTGVNTWGALSGDLALYALLAGRAGGQTLIGGTASGDDLTLDGTSHSADSTSNLRIQSPITLFPGGKLMSGSNGWDVSNEDFIKVENGSVFEINDTTLTGRQPSYLTFGGNFRFTGLSTSYVGAGPNLFANFGTLSADHGINFSAVSTFYSSMTIAPDTGVTLTLLDSNGFGGWAGSFFENTVFGGAGSYNSGAIWNQFLAQGSVNTGKTIGTLNAFRCAKPSISGTLTVRKCFVVNDHTESVSSPATPPGKTIGIENAALTTFPPKIWPTSGTVVSGTTIVPRATTVTLNIFSIGQAMTACPTFEAGESGQILILYYDGIAGAAKTLSISDDDTNNGCAGWTANTVTSGVMLENCGDSTACSIVIGKGDTLSLVYSTQLNRWVETGRSNNGGGPMVNPPQIVAVTAAATTLTPVAKAMAVSSNALNLGLTSCPHIPVGVDGQEVTIVGTSTGTNSLLFYDYTTAIGCTAPATSGLNLGATSRTLGAGDTLSLVYSATNLLWSETAYANN